VCVLKMSLTNGYCLQVEDKTLHVELRNKWPPLEQTIIHSPKTKLNTSKLNVLLNVSDLGSSPKGSSHLSPTISPHVSPSQSPCLSPRKSLQDSPKQSPQISHRGYPHVYAEKSPNTSPINSPNVSPKDSPHSSPYHSAEESPYNSPGESPQQSPLVSAHSSPRESPQPKLPIHTKEDNEPITSDQQPIKDKPVVPSRTKKLPFVSQYHEEISKARRRSTPAEVSIK